MTEFPLAFIEGVDQEGRGIARIDGKVIFVDQAVLGETVRYRITRNKASYANAVLVSVEKASSHRIPPKCPHYGICGGCAMQHIDGLTQVALKQRMLEENFQRIGKIMPERILSPIIGSLYGYRHKARLRVRYVERKDKVLVGFNEKASSFVTLMTSCLVLPPKISALIEPLQHMIWHLSIRSHIPQIEVAVGENTAVLVFRILQPLSTSDEQQLRDFAAQHAVQVWLQTKEPETAQRFYPSDAADLYYRLPEFGLVYPFQPTEFTQVNPQVNQALVKRSMHMLKPCEGEAIADFFCGIGNFTLPIARYGARVSGFEGSPSLVRRAQQVAYQNGLQQVQFIQRDLFKVTTEDLRSWGRFEKWLLDPPRDGAMELIKAIQPDLAPRRIVYVSCNPATLARDAQVLVHVLGYRLCEAGVVNMFPHTGHVESIACFEARDACEA